jgi:hypothetical protein
LLMAAGTPKERDPAPPRHWTVPPATGRFPERPWAARVELPPASPSSPPWLEPRPKTVRLRGKPVLDQLRKQRQQLRPDSLRQPARPNTRPEAVAAPAHRPLAVRAAPRSTRSTLDRFVAFAHAAQASGSSGPASTLTLGREMPGTSVGMATPTSTLPESSLTDARLRNAVGSAARATCLGSESTAAARAAALAASAADQRLHPAIARWKTIAAASPTSGSIASSSTAAWPVPEPDFPR